jgi:hypothetical protein
MANERKSLSAFGSLAQKLYCVGCKTSLEPEEFWDSNGLMSSLRMTKESGRKSFLCKDCTRALYKMILTECEGDHLEALFQLCATNDWYYDDLLAQSVTAELASDDIMPDRYLEVIFNNEEYKGKTFYKQLSRPYFVKMSSFKESEDELTEEDKQNRNDIKKAFGYDPFETKPISQKSMLYRSLNQMVDPTLNNDLVRQRAAIEIVTNYEEIDRLDVAIAKLSLTPDDIVKNAKDLETLRKMKSDVNKNISMLCKDHGLSAKYANSKSRGAGTLSGIMRDMEDNDYDEGVVNLYDIETSTSIQQCSDISAKSIATQLKLSESDYAEMVEEQAIVVRQEIAARKKAEEALRVCKEYLRRQELIADLVQEYKRKGLSTAEIEELITPELKGGKL